MAVWQPLPHTPILQRHHPHARGLVGAWPGTSDRGLLVADIAGKNNGTLVLNRVNGQYGPAFNFDGSSFRFNTQNSDVFNISNVATRPFTILILLKSTSTPSDSHTIATIGSVNYQAFSFSHTSTGVLQIVGDTTGAAGWDIVQTFSNPIASNTWHWLSLSRDEKGVYQSGIDGRDAGSYTNAGNLVLNNNHLKFGSHYSGAAGYNFVGNMADARFYNRVVSLIEIRDIITAPWDIYAPEIDLPWAAYTAGGGGGPPSIPTGGPPTGRHPILIEIDTFVPFRRY